MRKILLVEDEDILRETYQTILSMQPIDVDAAPNGQAALDLCDDKTYDLILLDLMMPVLDGVGFLRKYMPTALPETRIIVLSNLSSGEELGTAMALGAHINVLKSDLSPRELLTLVRYQLEAT